MKRPGATSDEESKDDGIEVTITNFIVQGARL
jgi:hypothetical protein